MNEPIMFTLQEVVDLIRAITWLIGSISVIAGAVLWFWSKLRKPNKTQDQRLDALEQWKDDVDKRLNDGNNHFKQVDESNKVTQTALLALLAHGIDGNSVEPMRKAKKELEDYLVNK